MKRQAYLIEGQMARAREQSKKVRLIEKQGRLSASRRTMLEKGRGEAAGVHSLGDGAEFCGPVGNRTWCGFSFHSSLFNNLGRLSASRPRDEP